MRQHFKTARPPPLQFRDFQRKRGRRSVGVGTYRQIPAPGVVYYLQQKSSSIRVHWFRVFSSCLLIVMLLTKRLPVVLIPKELLISTVRHDVVDDRCLHVPSFPLAHTTKRMRCEKSPALLLPPAAIPTACSRPGNLRVKRQVLLTIFTSRHNQLTTTGLAAGNHRFLRHPSFLPKAVQDNRRSLTHVRKRPHSVVIDPVHSFFLCESFILH